MKPILFNTEMVRALLDGRKSVTRRVIKPRPVEPYAFVEDGELYMTTEYGDWYPAERFCRTQPGDTLYVQETFFKDVNRYMYRANYSDNEKFYRDGKEVSIRWHPSIHMPKEAARVFLRVTDVRVERLQDITEEQAEAEGVKGYWAYPHRDCPPFIGAGQGKDCLCFTRAEAFSQIWNSTIKKAYLPLYGWDVNPWVWVIEFERISKEEALRY